MVSVEARSRMEILLGPRRRKPLMAEASGPRNLVRKKPELLVIAGSGCLQRQDLGWTQGEAMPSGVRTEQVLRSG